VRSVLPHANEGPCDPVLASCVETYDFPIATSTLKARSEPESGANQRSRRISGMKKRRATAIARREGEKREEGARSSLRALKIERVENERQGNDWKRGIHKRREGGHRRRQAGKRRAEQPERPAATGSNRTKAKARGMLRRRSAPKYSRARMVKSKL